MQKWIAILLFISSLAHANCTIYFNDQPLEEKKIDPLFTLVTQSIKCPTSITELHHIIHNKKLTKHTTMVANRGRNNPAQGSFSFFESITGRLPKMHQIAAGDFFLGYFTELRESEIVLDQKPTEGKLLIEAIAWDQNELLYNFYELRGSGGKGHWYYRGNSQDAYHDNQWLYRQSPAGEAHFGKRMRCSACHNSGGPIMKEQVFPYNDWWRLNRPLIFTPNQPDAEVQLLIDELTDADLLATDVRKGAAKLAKSRPMADYVKSLSMQEQLRPLFCTTEINLQASAYPLDGRVFIPSSFWINPLLGEVNLAISAEQYHRLLAEFNMHFPETSLRDADNPWLSPVKGEADLLAIKALVKNHVITQYFAQAVLLIDFTHPLYSAQRCDLLKLVPKDADHWFIGFIDNLKQHPQQAGAQELLSYLTEESLDYSKKVNTYTLDLVQQSGRLDGLKNMYQLLIERREEVLQSEMSQNPLGQILEPGFRVIFPAALSSVQPSLAKRGSS